MMRDARLPVRRLAVFLAAVVACACIVGAVGHPLAHWVDLHWTGGAVKDAWGRLRWHEDWDHVARLPSGLDRAWLDGGGRPLRIAHALGASGTPAANTFGALDTAARDGFRLFEVDLWLDDSGELRCEHDDETRGPLEPTDCTLARLLPRIAALGGWAVLDIKSNFAAAADTVVRLVQSDGLAALVIFQLYRPEDVNRFARLSKLAPFPEPIVSVYAAHRSARYIASRASALDVRALTVPLEEVGMLGPLPEGVALFVHPVHDCAAWRMARAARAAGIYTLAGLDCNRQAVSGPVR